MTRSFLFGGNASGQSQNKYLVEFKAGKMTMKDKTVSADKRKGLVYVNQTDDTLMHFCWKDRTTGVLEDDLIIFPDDVIFKRVPECTTGRVFVLKFKSSSRRCFYWLQEPKTDRDSEFCTKVNQYLNNPPNSSRSGAGSSLGGSSTPSQGGGALPPELASIGDENLQNLLNNMSQQQLMQFLGGVGVGGIPSLSSFLGSSVRLGGVNSSASSHSTADTPTPPVTTQSSQSATPTPAATTTTTPSATPTTTSSSTAPTTRSGTNSAAIQLSDLQSILSGLNVPATSADNAQDPAKAGGGPGVDLSTAITAEALQPLFNNKQLMDRLQTLLPQAPDQEGSLSENLRSTVQSPQFHQALNIFSAALQSGQLGPLMQQFGLPSDAVAAANSGDMDAFVRALQSANQSKGGKSSGDKKDGKDTDKDEDMSLD